MNSARFSAGLQLVEIGARDGMPAFPAIVLYPSTYPAGGTSQIGPYTFHATRDAPIAQGRYPVCVISHGGGGSHLLYRSIATHVAQQGWVVVCPEHPFDNRNDRSRVGTDDAARDRPRHLVHAIDALVQHEQIGAHVDAARVAVVGHSMGGFAALALAGGRPWSAARLPLDTVRDERVRAVVLLAPSVDWYRAPESLAQVHVPVLAMVGEHDTVTPPANVQRVLDTLPPSAPCTVEVVPGAGHFSFLSPFPPAMTRADFPPSTDPPGFDRPAFHEILPARVAEFLATAAVA